jgi:hypothetical protein
MEFWNDGITGRKEEKSLLIAGLPLVPFFQFSIIPIFHVRSEAKLGERDEGED